MMNDNGILGTAIFAIFLIIALVFGQVAFHFRFAWYWIVAVIVGLSVGLTFILAKL